ncbi:MATE family efflux transporter [Atopobacter phocae]|uniref:MATE family efflux transporter n=1 Tax=Atopobacter phocae TaxID=136492 RepID=UPI0004712718|nr:MATE family efflux transporter [Atopobacter phocae]
MAQDMTKGKPAKLIISFAIPLLIGNVFQQVYNMVDTFIVGRTLGVNALASLGATGSLMFLILGFVQGTTSGLAIPIAQKFGAKDYRGLRRSFAANIIVGILVSIGLTIFSLMIVKQLLHIMKTPPEIIEQSIAYIQVIFAGIPIILLFNVGMNTLRSLGDSKKPLIFLMITSLLNIILDIVLIVHFNMGVVGAAYATIASILVATIANFIYIFRSVPILLPRREDWKLTHKELKEHVRIGLPMGIQTSIIAVGSVSVQIALNGLGPNAIAAYTAAQKIDQVGIMILMSFGITMATYIGQNYGAHRYERMWEGVTSCIKISVSISIIMGIIFILLAEQLILLFVGNAAVEVIHFGREYFYCVAGFYSLLSLLFIYRSTLQGLGQTFVPTLAGFMELAMRILAAFVLVRYIGFKGVALSSPLAWFGANIPLIYTFYLTKKRINRNRQQYS